MEESQGKKTDRRGGVGRDKSSKSQMKDSASINQQDQSQMGSLGRLRGTGTGRAGGSLNSDYDESSQFDKAGGAGR